MIIYNILVKKKSYQIKNKLKKIYSSSSSELNFIIVSSNNVERERNRVENKEKE